MPYILKNNSMQQSPNIIMVKSSKALHLLDPKEIVYCKIENESVSIKLLSDEKIITYNSLKELELKLINHSFYRCHAKYLINLHLIKQYIHKTGELLMFDNNFLTVAKDRKSLFYKKIKSF